MARLTIIALMTASALAIAASASPIHAQSSKKAAAPGAAGGATASEDIAGAYYDPARNAASDVDSALAAARISGKAVLVVFGGNWCRDSRALGVLLRSERFAPMLAARYELVFVDVGMRDRNLDLARRFGLHGIRGTPTALILRADGTPRNLGDAPRWRNAASRKPAAVFRYFERAVPPT